VLVGEGLRFEVSGVGLDTGAAASTGTDVEGVVMTVVVGVAARASPTTATATTGLAAGVRVFEDSVAGVVVVAATAGEEEASCADDDDDGMLEEEAVVRMAGASEAAWRAAATSPWLNITD
jgi:hypothetical protein